MKVKNTLIFLFQLLLPAIYMMAVRYGVVYAEIATKANGYSAGYYGVYSIQILLYGLLPCFLFMLFLPKKQEHKLFGVLSLALAMCYTALVFLPIPLLVPILDFPIFSYFFNSVSIGSLVIVAGVFFFAYLIKIILLLLPIKDKGNAQLNEASSGTCE